MNPQPPCLLRLFVAGTGASSERAAASLRRLCDEVLGDAYELEVIDVLVHPARAEQDNIIALPTVVRVRPLPMRRVIGDLDEVEQVLEGLDLARAEAEGTTEVDNP